MIIAPSRPQWYTKTFFIQNNSTNKNKNKNPVQPEQEYFVIRKGMLIYIDMPRK